MEEVVPLKIPEFKLERFFAAHEFSAPYLLCSSDGESMSCGELMALEEGSEEKLGKLWLGYTETPGSPELRDAIAGLYTGIGREDIIVLTGAEEGIFLLFNALLEAGDHAIVQFPAYQSLYEIPRSTGCEVTRWPLEEKESWELPLDFLEKNLRKNTKAVVINTPHNPTGYLMPERTYRQLIALCRERGIHLFCDEVYRLLEYRPEARLPAMCDCYEKGISLGVMSKVFGLAGLRIGWIALRDRALRERIAALKDYTTICNSAPSEFFSIIALRHREHLLKRNLDIVTSNLRLLEQFFQEQSRHFSWVKPQAGPISFPSLREGKSAEAFCMDLLQKKGVLLLPGSLYDYDDSHFRLGFGRKNMPEALTMLSDYMNNVFAF